jgi:CrcB protein
MDQPTHSRPDDGDEPQRARRDLPEGTHPELLDEPSLPAFGLSVSTMAAIFVGGAVGTMLRYLLEVHHPIGPGGFPWPTLVVNLSGSFVIGLILPLTEHVSRRLPVVRPLFVVGLLGGWTTYSTLAVEATLLAKDGRAVTGLAYLAATVVGGVGLVMIGHDAGRRLLPS